MVRRWTFLGLRAGLLSGAPAQILHCLVFVQNSFMRFLLLFFHRFWNRFGCLICRFCSDLMLRWKLWLGYWQTGSRAHTMVCRNCLMQSRYQGPKKKVSQRRMRKMKKVKEALREVKKARRMEKMVKEHRGEGRNSGAERVFCPRYSTRLVSLFSLSFPIPVFWHSFDTLVTLVYSISPKVETWTTKRTWTVRVSTYTYIYICFICNRKPGYVDTCGKNRHSYRLMLHGVCIQYSVFRIQYSMSVSIYVLIYMRCSLESRTHIYDREPNLPVVLREGSQLPLTQARCAQSFEREKQRTQAQLGSARLDAIDSRNDSKKKLKTD